MGAVGVLGKVAAVEASDLLVGGFHTLQSQLTGRQGFIADCRASTFILLSNSLYLVQLSKHKSFAIRILW